VEDLALDRASLQHSALGLVELVESGREQRLQRRRHHGLRVVGGHRKHLGDEQRIAAGGVLDARAKLLSNSFPDQFARLFRRQRLQPQRPGPAGPPLHELGPGHAQEQKWRTHREQRGRLDEVEERLVSPLDVVEDDDQRRQFLEQLPERPGDLVAARPDVGLAQQRSDRRCGDRI
jgi:hypothetical protein